MVSVTKLGNSATPLDGLIDKELTNFQENIEDSD